MNQERENYVESEFKKWKEMYEINYINEYDVKLLLSLRHQLEETPDEKIKTKVDLINAINNLTKNLNLKPKEIEAKEKREILLLVDRFNQIRDVFDTLISLVNKETIVKKMITHDFAKLETTKYDIRIRSISDNIRGIRSKGNVFKLTSHRDVQELLS